MDSKTRILNAALALVHEQGGDLHKVTMRALCERANVGLGLVSYHFGGKDGLMAACAEQIVSGVIDQFEQMRDGMPDLPPYERLKALGELTFSYLFNHDGISRMSILQDMNSPGPGSNTMRTWNAFLPLVKECRPDLSESAARAAAWSLIVQMQQAFLQHEHVRLALGVDLTDAAQRSAFHTAILDSVVGRGGMSFENSCN